MLAINKIQEASTSIYALAKYEDCTDIVKDELKKAYKLMEEFIRANTKEKKGGRLDMFKFVCKDGLRPAMAGVYHDQKNERAVASDTHVLITSKSDYNPEYAGHTVTKLGEVLGTDEDPIRYPNWKAIIPNVNNGYYVKLDKAALEEKIRQAQAQKKLDKKSKMSFVIKMEFDNQGAECIYFDLDSVAMLLNMPGDIYVNHHNRPACYEDDNYQVVIMPRMAPNETLERVF